MIVSYNEIQALVRKAGEARGLEPGLREDVADACAWLARHGLPGLELADLVLQRDRPAAPQPLAEPGHWDLAGGSLLLWLQPLLEHNRALNGPDAELILENARDPLAMLPIMLETGPELQADWQAEDAPSVDRVSTAEQSLCGRFRQLPDATGILRTQFTAPEPAPEAPWLTAAALAERRTYTLHHGIDVSEAAWENLKALAKNVLVEATDASRQRGAGEIT